MQTTPKTENASPATTGQPKIKDHNVEEPKAFMHSAGSFGLSWSIGPARFHVWLAGETGNFTVRDDCVYKNSKTPYRDAATSKINPGYFPTRKLKASSGEQQRVLAYVFSKADFAKAEADFAAKQATEEAQRQANNARFALQDRAKENAPAILETLQTLVAELDCGCRMRRPAEKSLRDLLVIMEGKE